MNANKRKPRRQNPPGQLFQLADGGAVGANATTGGDDVLNSESDDLDLRILELHEYFLLSSES